MITRAFHVMYGGWWLARALLLCCYKWWVSRGFGSQSILEEALMIGSEEENLRLCSAGKGILGVLCVDEIKEAGHM